MKLVRAHAPGRYEIDDVSAPQSTAADAVIQVRACGVCGSDIHFVRGGALQADGAPMPLGHEAAGVVRSVGPNVVGVEPGMRVFINPMGDPANVIGKHREEIRT
jgi:threonine dehydrogenase-like Zn-dependent dehydrogenase